MFQPNEMSDMFMKANGAFADSMMKMSSVALEAQGQMARRQMAMFEKCMDAGNRQMSMLKDVRDGGEFIAKSSELATDFGQEMASMMRETMDAQAEMMNTIMAAWQPEAVAPAPAPKKPVRKAAAA